MCGVMTFIQKGKRQAVAFFVLTLGLPSVSSGPVDVCFNVRVEALNHKGMSRVDVADGAELCLSYG